VRKSELFRPLLLSRSIARLAQIESAVSPPPAAAAAGWIASSVARQVGTDNENGNLEFIIMVHTRKRETESGRWRRWRNDIGRQKMGKTLNGLGKPFFRGYDIFEKKTA
jgi:hypothetical protein